MDYYLYSHSNANGVFYIGKGTKNRAKHLENKSDKWYNASKKGYTIKIIANGSEADIFALEKKVIRSLSEQGVNLVNKLHNVNFIRPMSQRVNISKGHLIYNNNKLPKEIRKRKAERIAYWKEKGLYRTRIKPTTAFK